MDISKILAELREEQSEIERAIMALVRIGGRKRGRPPKWMKAIDDRNHTERSKKKSVKT